MSAARWRVARLVLVLVTLFVLLLAGRSMASPSEAAPPAEPSTTPWWVWPVILFVFCTVLGVLAVLAGVGGGVLYVPLVSGFFPFHIDFVRGAGLMVALAGALAAGPGLLRRNLASLRLSMPVALVASIFSIVGRSWVSISRPSIRGSSRSAWEWRSPGSPFSWRSRGTP
jgi:hypothetical protein